ncbi:uncharacterized protein fam217ba [Trichomycterus rosablanca]|uniref:uncharacterized protein fam217ba n=1 Tax=Trichomycterus rosablanca TaxID=2290929 RepID=UPI002F35E3E0
MGPILQEGTESTILKKVQVKEKVKVKNAENTAVVTSNNKTGSKVKQNQKPQKKTSSLQKNVIPVQDIHPLSRAKIGQNRNRQKPVRSPTAGAHTMLNTQFEADTRHPKPRHFPLAREEERQKVQHQSHLCTEQSYAMREKSRRALSLPLAPHQFSFPKHVPDLKALHLEHREDDTDSASDLSDSERLPVLPSPCTPPQLNLRAEIVNTMDLHPHIPGPRTGQTGSESYSYPDFLPPPFNTWSLRQLAVFLNTDGKRAPRPKPVGQLEKYLERLLQLEWHQIQTIQAENGRGNAANVCPRGRTLYGPQVASFSRPHTAPPTRLSSPKSVRQSQPFTLLSSLGSPSSCRLSRCLYSQVRYPMCNGSCSSYAYQRHSRLSPLLERKAPPNIAQKRSSSESRASADNRVKTHYPVSPRIPQKHMQPAGNGHKVSQESSGKSKDQGPARKGYSGGADQVTVERQKDTLIGRSAVDKRIVAGNKREVSGLEQSKEKQCTQTGSTGKRDGVKTVVVESNKGKQTHKKAKNVQLAK